MMNLTNPHTAPTPTITAVPASIAKAINKTLVHEGGFVNDPRDPGGATNWGFTLRTMQAHGLDVNGDDIVNIDDVRYLTKKVAFKYYAQIYFFDVLFHLAPAILQEQMFDHGVLFGQHNAVRLLQKILNEAGYFRIATDGIMGPRTAKAADDWIMNDCETADDAVLAYCLARRKAAFAKAERYPNLKWAVVNEAGEKGGWIIRIESYLPESKIGYHLSHAQFKARIATW